MAVPGRLRPFLHRANPRMARFAGRVPPFLVVQHTGRTSGRPYRTPVIAFRAKGVAAPTYLSPLPWGPDTDWCRNIRAAGSYRVTRRGREYAVDGVWLVPRDEAVRLLPVMGRVGDRVARSQAWLAHELRPLARTP